MPALLGDPAVLKQQDAVGRADGGQAVRDDEAGAALQGLLDRVLDEHLGFRIHRGGGLVQHKQPGIVQDGAGKGDQLLFACGQPAAALAHLAVIALVHLPDEGISIDQPGGGHGLLPAGLRIGVAQVVHHRAREQVRLLQHIAQGGLQPQLAALPVIHAVDQDAPGSGLIKAAQQVHDGGFAGAGGADDGDGLARPDVQIKITEDLGAVLVAEGDVLKGDGAMDLLPVLAPGVEVVAIFLDHRRAVLDVRLGLQQADHALGRGLDALHLGEGGGDVADGVEKLH